MKTQKCRGKYSVGFMVMLCVVNTAACMLLFSSGLSFADARKSAEALTKLLDGNKRFVSGKLAPKDLSAARRKELLKGQQPSAIVVTCSESTVVPEIIFDQGLGDIFTVRAAGSVLDALSAGSIEFAARQLHTPLLIMLGHDKCSIVSAALEAKAKTDDNIWLILRKILPAVRKASSAGGTPEEIFKNAVRENLLLQQKYLLRKSAIVRNLVASGDLKIVTGIYHDDSGMVELFNAQ